MLTDDELRAIAARVAHGNADYPWLMSDEDDDGGEVVSVDLARLQVTIVREFSAALTAAAERERVLREKVVRLADVAEYLARTGMGTGTVLAAVANTRAALEATS